MEQCFINLNCNDYDRHPSGLCVNDDYCYQLSRPLNLPYRYKSDSIGSFLEIKFIWYYDNTKRDLEECGWSEPQFLYYQWCRDNVGWYKDVIYQDEDLGFYCPHHLPYFKNSERLEVVINVVGGGWAIAKSIEHYYKFYELDGCQILVIIKNNKKRIKQGWAKAKNLPLQKTKTGWRVTRNIEGYYYKSWSIKPYKYFNQHNWHEMPHYYKTINELRLMGLKLSSIQSHVSIWDSCKSFSCDPQSGSRLCRARFYLLYDYRECVPL